MEKIGIIHSLLDEELNNYAIDRIYTFLELFGAYMDNNTIIKLEEKIVNNKVIEVRLSPKEKKKENLAQINNDNLIHIYYDNDVNNDYSNNEKLADKIIKSGIIDQEIIKIFIKLDYKSHLSDKGKNQDKTLLEYENNLDDDEKEFSYFITDGMVEYISELTRNTKNTSSKYRKNIELAKLLIKNLDQTNWKSIILRNNYFQIRELYPNTNIVFEEFKKLKEFLKDLKIILEDIAKSYMIDVERELESLKKYTIEETKIKLQSKINEYIIDNDDKEYYYYEIEELYDKYYNTEKEDYKL